MLYYTILLLERKRKEATEEEYQQFGPVLKITCKKKRMPRMEMPHIKMCHIKLNWRAD